MSTAALNRIDYYLILVYHICPEQISKHGLWAVREIDFLCEFSIRQNGPDEMILKQILHVFLSFIQPEVD